MKCPRVLHKEGSTRCLHWRACLTAEQEAAGNATCEIREQTGPWGTYHSPQCCIRGYAGPLCEFCEEDLVRIDGSCMKCEGVECVSRPFALTLCDLMS